MASAIDTTKPTAIAPTTASVRDNFSAAKAEIEALQEGAGLAHWTAGLAAAAPNDPIKTSSLTATDAATNVDAALIPKGTGAILAAIPDNTTTGGNKRGTYAVDWQSSRTTAAAVASGTAATIAGGRNNKASATDTTIAGGKDNNATATGAAIGGGSTNTASGNYSVIKGGYGNQATAQYAAIGGGSGHVASDAWSTIAGGTLNNATGGYSSIGGGGNNLANSQFGTIPGGYAATTRAIIGALAYSSGLTDTIGDAQLARYIVRAKSFGTTPKTLTTNNAAANAGNQITLPNNATYDFSARLSARNPANGDSAAFTFSGMIKRGANAAATALLAPVSATMTANDAGAAAWALDVTADTVNGCLKIAVIGATSTTIKWTCVVETVETTD